MVNKAEAKGAKMFLGLGFRVAGFCAPDGVCGLKERNEGMGWLGLSWGKCQILSAGCQCWGSWED